MRTNILKYVSIAAAVLMIVSGIVSLMLHKNETKLSDDLLSQQRLIQKVTIFKKNKTQWDRIDKHMFAGKSSSEYISRLISQIQSHRLRLINIKPDERDTYKYGEGDINMYPVTFKLTGAFTHVYTFLNALERDKLFVLLNTMLIEKINEKSVEMQITLHIPVTGAAYE
jgi:hypothetical protein